jgi:hypothetical protein
LRRLYYRVLQRRGKARAKVAVARTLLVRLYIMRRDQIDYAEFRRRARAPGRRERVTNAAPGSSAVERPYREMSNAAFPWWRWFSRTDILIGTPTRGEFPLGR